MNEPPYQWLNFNSGAYELSLDSLVPYLQFLEEGNKIEFFFQVESLLFRPTTGGGRKMCEDLNVPFLGSLPVEPKVARACDEGTNYLKLFPNSPTCLALKNIVESMSLCPLFIVVYSA